MSGYASLRLGWAQDEIRRLTDENRRLREALGIKDEHAPIVSQYHTRCVTLESPFRGDTPEETEDNIAFARACMKDCLKRGEAVFASHLLYTQPGVLDDANPIERKQGIEAGLAWKHAAAATVVYLDRGMSEGMKKGYWYAKSRGLIVEERYLDERRKPK